MPTVALTVTLNAYFSGIGSASTDITADVLLGVQPLRGNYGISGTGPEGMKGVDSYPLLFAELARRGWSDANLAKLSQNNVLRVMEGVEATARAMNGAPPTDANDPG